MSKSDHRGKCSFCGEEYFTQNLMEMGGRVICFPCALVHSYMDMKENEGRTVRSYEDALREQRAGQKVVDMWNETGIKETKRGALYYPDEEHCNVLHIVASFEED